MRIAFVKLKYVPFGGGEVYLDRLMQELQARQHQVHLITTAWNNNPNSNSHHISIHNVSCQSHSRAARVRSFSHSVAHYLDSHPFDIVFSLERTEQQDVWRAGEGVHLNWLRQRRQFESPLRCWFNERSPGQKTLLHLERLAIQNSRLIIANSHFIGQELRDAYDLDTSKLAVVPNGTDLNRFNTHNRTEHRDHLRQEWNLAENQPVLLFVGSGFRRKGLLETLQALTEFPDCTLLILGRDKPGPWLKKAKQLGLSHQVRFLPPTSNIASVYQAADVLTLPSWYDAFGNVGLEAIACGTPTITTPHVGMCEFITEGQNGSLIPRPDATPDFINAIRHHLNLRSQPDRANQIAQSVQHCSLENNLTQVLQHLESLTPKKTSPQLNP